MADLKANLRETILDRAYTSKILVVRIIKS